MMNSIKEHINAIRADFPILTQKVYGKNLVYFDNAATTQKPEVVLKAIEDGYRLHNANVHRGVHYLSQVATEAHENARRTVRNFIGAESESQIIFTRGTTESINLVAFSFGELLKAGQEIIVSEMEHHSNIVPWQLLCERKGLKLKVIPFFDNGELDITALDTLLTDKTALVAVTHVSNTLGTVNPVKQIIEKAHTAGVPVLIDGAQSVAHKKVNVAELDADFFVFSGHKIYGPTGIGVLYGKENWLERMVPYQAGGEMIEHVSFEKTTFNVLPYKFEAGTPDFIGSTALAAALDYVNALGIENISEYETELLKYATERLNEVDGLKIYGDAAEKGAVISMNVGNIHHYDMGTLLDKLGLALRTGHHCAEPVMTHYGIEGTLRASFALYNTKEEIDVMIEGIKKVLNLFNRGIG